jgi:PPP family 3-phenylpropionic acid transporter
LTAGAVADAPPRRTLLAFGAVSFAYFAYSGLFLTYAPLWYQSLGYSTLAIGVLSSVQSATRVASPYAWGWVADQTGRRERVLQVAVGLSLICACGFLIAPDYAWTMVVTAALFVCTAGVIPISEAALAHLVSRGGTLDAGRYGRVRVWGSFGFILAVSTSGFVLQTVGVGRFPVLLIALLALLLIAALRLPVLPEAPHDASGIGRALAVLKRPAVAWFFAGLFFTVLAHTSLYAFFSLYLDSLGYSRSAVGLIWATSVAVEVVWFWYQGAFASRLSMHGWLIAAALLSALRFALVAAFGAVPWLLVLSQGLHAVTFAAQHTACIAVINRYFPGRLRGRGQALYTVLGYGIPGVLGGVAGGALIQALGYAAVFWAASGCGVLAAACCWRAWALEQSRPAVAG